MGVRIRNRRSALYAKTLQEYINIRMSFGDDYVVAGIISKDEIIIEMNNVTYGHFMLRDYLNSKNKKVYDDDFKNQRNQEFVKFRYLFRDSEIQFEGWLGVDWFVRSFETERIQNAITSLPDYEVDMKNPCIVHITSKGIKLFNENDLDIARYKRRG